MEREKLNKKQIIPLVIGVLTLVILVSSATYAYFSVTSGKTAGSTTITGDIGGGTLGTVTLSGGGTELYLGISAYDMSQTESGKTYYSSTTEGSRETNINNAEKTTYTATLSGDESDSVMYACDYEFTVASSGSALESEHISDISVVFEGDINKTVALSSSQTVKGTWFGFKNSNKEREFNAYLQLNNTESEQNDLAGTNLSVEIANTKWNCYLSELDELVGEAYAILTENGKTNFYGDAMYDLTFIRSEIPYNVGDTYNDKEIIEVYTGFENETYTSSSEVPWIEQNNDFSDFSDISIVFEDEIRPTSIAYWFNLSTKYEVYNFDAAKLNTSLVTNMSYALADMVSNGELVVDSIENWDTSNVTDMSYMFSNSMLMANLSNWDVSNVTNMSGMFKMDDHDSYIAVGLENWDVSSVTDMSHMFRGYFNLDVELSKWDVSSVTDMSYMFCSTENSEYGDLSKWNVSNVTDMEYMFMYATINKVGNISGWNTGNVTNMDSMFDRAIINVDMDLSGWDVSNVRYYEGFNADISGTGKLTPPIWPTTN